MILLTTLMVLAGPEARPFPERMPGMIGSCLADAVDDEAVSATDDEHKYICTGQPAEQLWAFLEAAKIESYEQNAGSEGHWLTREFPLGACFKRARTADGAPATSGLSCTIWIPRAVGQ